MRTKTLLVLCAFFVSTFVFGAKYTVTNTNESGVGSLVWAYESATAAEDIIAFDVDAVELTLQAAISKSLTIDGMNQFNDKRMIFKKLTPNKFFDLVGITITLKSLILDGENTPSAIGITADNASTLNIENCVLRNINSNGAGNNGGACRVQGVVTIKNSLFENNTQGPGSYGGGAICIYNTANIIIENTSFVGNTAVEGGAIAAIGTVAPGYTLKASNCTFANNIAARDGAADQRGGAVYLKGPTATQSYATFINCTFTGNSAAKNGGALCAFASAGKKININLVNSIFVYNMSAGTKYSDIDIWNVNDRINFPTATNCIYGKLFGTGVEADLVWTNSINTTNVAEADVFSQKETWMTTFERPIVKDINDKKVVLLSEASIANNAGVATIDGFTIPTADQLGKVRPATPAIGAVEYTVLSGVDKTMISSNIKINVQGKYLSFTGLDTETEMSVYGLTGNLLDKRMVDNHNVVRIDNFKTNFIIVRVQNQNFKVFIQQ